MWRPQVSTDSIETEKDCVDLLAAAVTCLVVDDSTCSAKIVASPTADITVGGSNDTKPLTKEQADELLRPSAFNWADETDDCNYTRISPLSKKQADELLHPSAFNWADETDDEECDSGYVSPELLTPPEGSYSGPGSAAKPMSDYCQADYHNVAEEMVRKIAAMRPSSACLTQSEENSDDDEESRPQVSSK
jgi:hypothetical protein